jgi:PKD repeat protein
MWIVWVIDMERDQLMQIVILIIAVVALILAVFAIVVPGDEDEKDEDGDDGINIPPTAVISSSKTTVQIGEYINFDGSGSSDPDGNLIEYTWYLGNGLKDSGMYVLFMYSESGTFNVSLIVIDDDGETGNAITTITVLPNTAPQATISMGSTSFNIGENAFFNASGSSDSDGRIVEYTWDFGDGTKDSGLFTNHIYLTAGDYTVILTVIDDDGASDVDSADITILDPGGPPDNDPPVAEIVLSKTEVEVDRYFVAYGHNSSDPDGDIVAYLWDFGDGNTGYGIYYEHEYTTVGTYNITLTVYDNDGASDTTNATINVVLYTPVGAFSFWKSSPGNYTGGIISLSAEVQISDVSLIIIDSSSGFNAVHNPIQSGIPLQVGAGFRLTYTDTNSNNKLDAGDVWIAQNASDGDIIRLIFIPTGEIIAEYPFIETTPVGSLNFNENTPGNYTGGIISLSDQVFIIEALLFIEDASTGLNATHDPMQSGTPLQAGLGLIVTYDDSNHNGKLDAGDVWTVQNGASGDIIKLIFISTGGTIASFTLS